MEISAGGRYDGRFPAGTYQVLDVDPQVGGGVLDENMDVQYENQEYWVNVTGCASDGYNLEMIDQRYVMVNNNNFIWWGLYSGMGCAAMVVVFRLYKRVLHEHVES